MVHPSRLRTECDCEAAEASSKKPPRYVPPDPSPFLVACSLSNVGMVSCTVRERQGGLDLEETYEKDGVLSQGCTCMWCFLWRSYHEARSPMVFRPVRCDVVVG